MKSFLKALVLLFSIGSVWAADCSADLSWTRPVQNSDGSALALCASQTVTPTPACLRGYRVYHGTSPSALTTIVEVNDRNAVATTVVIPNCVSHTHYYAMVALTSAGVEGASTAVGNKVFTIVTIPNPPGNFTVKPDAVGGTITSVYKLRQEVNKFSMALFGTIPAGSACRLDSPKIENYCVVAREEVRRNASTDPYPPILFAKYQ